MDERQRSTELAGVAFPHLEPNTALRQLLSPTGLKTPTPWRFINTYSLSLIQTDTAYATILRGPGVNLADGRPVAWVLGGLSRLRHAPGRVGHTRGPGFFVRALDEGREYGVKHYFLGGTPETLDALVRSVRDRFPGVLIAGATSPPFRPLTRTEQSAQDELIRQSNADLVWVGLGTPRQDVEALRIAQSVGKPVLAVGAAFDFVSGRRPEAPAWIQRLALEWLHRLLTEPRRLWRRYTIGIFRFGLIAARELRRQHASDYSS